MAHPDTIKLLQECDAGTKMGVSSIDEVLEKVKEEVKTKSGILLTTGEAKDAPSMGNVIAVGPGKTEDGKLTFYVDEGKFTGEKIEEAFFGCGGVAEIDNLQPKLLTMAKAGFRHHTTVGVGHMAKVLKEAFAYLGYDVMDI